MHNETCTRELGDKLLIFVCLFCFAYCNFLLDVLIGCVCGGYWVWVCGVGDCERVSFGQMP